MAKTRGCTLDTPDCPAAMAYRVAIPPVSVVLSERTTQYPQSPALSSPSLLLLLPGLGT